MGDAAEENDGQIIKVPNLLRAKLGTAPGPSLDQIVAEAETALGRLQDNYETWIRDYLKGINEALAEARAGPRPDPGAIERIRKFAHEIKGQGATFGYPLLTSLGDMLHRLIEQDGAAAARNLNLIAAHIDFMNLVIKDEIRGHGGAQEKRLLAALQAAAQKVREA
ncbi:MAG: Hpt domain-containing protein [Kiloniellaceae bacterium]